MKTQRVVIALTAVNLVFLLLTTAQVRSTTAQSLRSYEPGRSSWWTNAVWSERDSM